MTAASLAKSFLPRTPAPRRLPFGIGRGLRIEIDFARQTKLFLGLYEVELNSRLRALCRPGTHAFDVGSREGYDALVLARLCGGCVAAFDCDPLAIAALRRNLDANPRLGRAVTVYERAVGVGAGSLTLDEVAFGAVAFVPSFVKIDVEGAEADVLRGAERLLRDRAPHLVVETHSLEVERECLTLLRGCRYDVELVDPRRVLADLRPIQHNRWIVARRRA
jgi:hypothetical protein